MAMKERDRLGIGSTVSLQGGEHIPREYHRRILKKIAQLTKVIYNLNTKIDENEEFVCHLRAIHEAENKRIQDDSAAQLKKCEKGLVNERESAQIQVKKLSKALEDTREERNVLYEKQVSYRKEVEDHLSALKAQHTTTTQSFVTELEKFQSEQQQQLKQISELRSRLSKKAAEDIKALKLQHEEEIEEVRHDCKQQTQLLKNGITTLKSEHALEVDSLTKQFQAQLDAQSKSLSSAQRDLLSQERQAWEEKEKQLTSDFLEKEEQLKQHVSSLSKELRGSNDKLALAEQKIRDLEAKCDESQAGSGTLKALLEKSEADIECLRGTVKNLQADLDIAREKYKQQTAELQTASGNVAKLEALCVSNEGVIKNLQSELTSLHDKLKLLQEERDGMKSSQMNITEGQAVRIKVLEKEVGKLQGEKQELHTQFAREIEAAHAQLSHREIELEQQHCKAIKEAEEQHSKELANVNEENKSSLDSLKFQLVSQKEQELQKLQDSHVSQLSLLKAELADKALQLEQTLQEFRALRERLSKEEQGLGSATSEIHQLRADLSQCQTSLLNSQKECADVGTENAQLKSTLESLRRQKVEDESAHCEELKRTRVDLTAELEAVWRERVKHEIASVHTELSQRHGKEKRVALEELAGLKDSALRQAQGNWEGEQLKLLNKIESLQGELCQLQQAASTSLEEAKTSSNNQISSLRKELENEIVRLKETLANLQKAHQKQLQSLQTQNEQEKNVLSAQLHEDHKQELFALQQANQLAVNTLREKMESDKREVLSLAKEEHCKEMKTLEQELGLKLKEELSRVNKEHLVEIEKFRQQIEAIVTQSHKQVHTQEVIAGGLRKDIESRDSELGVLRDKSNSLTVAIADLRKQLTMREQELQLAKREAKSTLRIREQQLTATHHCELEAVNAQHRQKAQQLLTDFNKAKSLLSSKIYDLERQLSDWEYRYKMRESKPEDVEAIRELRMIVREQEQKMKDLVAEKRVYQLELMNREKNYNKLFNVNPQVGVLNPLQLKQRKATDHGVSSDPHKYASAPSLLAPLSPEPPALNPHLTPLPHSLKLTALTNDSELTSSNTHLSKKILVSQSSLENKPQKLVMLRDSPLTRKRGAPSEPSRKNLGSHSAPLQPVETQSQTAVSAQKHTMIVQ